MPISFPSFVAAVQEQVAPARLPDLYAGTQLVLAGRYRRAGTFDVTLRGGTFICR